MTVIVISLLKAMMRMMVVEVKMTIGVTQSFPNHSMVQLTTCSCSEKDEEKNERKKTKKRKKKRRRKNEEKQEKKKRKRKKRNA